MLRNYRRKKVYQRPPPDPMVLSVHNKFLASLSFLQKKKEEEERQQQEQQEQQEQRDTKLSISDDMREMIDRIVQRIDAKFAAEIHPLQQQSPPLEEAAQDPNVYVGPPPVEMLHRRCVHPYVPPPMRNNSQKQTITEHKTIAPFPVRDIGDLLSLIRTYPADPNVQYNIDIHALHRIREPLEELQSMVGMSDLKTNIVDQILYFVQNLHKVPTSSKSSPEFMHTVIYGPPGTGKTEIAKIMGQVYSKLGILEKGTFKKATRSDLIAGFLGQTAMKTRDVVKDALGGVLFIDEAYALGNQEKRDSFAKECIDTLCEALSDHKENLMVIIAGYEEELRECFFSYNQGLDSRFPWRFKTDAYTAEDLFQIFVKKNKECGWFLDAKSPPKVDWFKKNNGYFKYFGRDMETLLAKCKVAHGRRVFCLSEEMKRHLTDVDVENGFKMYLKNDEVRRRKEDMETKAYIYNSLYS